jgi:transposase
MARGLRQGVFSPPPWGSITAAPDMRPSRLDLDALRGQHRADRLRRAARSPQGRYDEPFYGRNCQGKKFLAYVEQCLAPTLKRKDIVVIDNLPAHKAAGVREAIEARGSTLLYLPKYSPDLNPIEMPFSKLKAFLRKVAERTIPRLRRRIGTFARSLTAREARNYFRHAGYA